MLGMSQRHNKKSRQPQGRGNPWTDAPRNQQPTPGHPPGHVGDGTGHEGVYSNSHVAHAVTTLIGCVVEVNTTSGVVYEGVLRAVSPNMDIVLSVAHDKSKILSRDNVKEVLELKCNSVVNISAKIEPNSSSSTDIFKTDTEISKSNGSSSGREFERFTDFADTPDSLEMENSKGWSVEDMFSVNREKFQVTSNFDEDLSQYTTELNRDSDGYTHRAARAKQLANEIEGKNKRGYDDVGTEEELFSAVVRGSEAPPLPPTPVTSSQLHTPTQSTTSTQRPHSDAPSMTENSNQPDSVACNQPSPSSISADLSTSVSKSTINNESGDIVSKAESAKDPDNHRATVIDTNNSTSNVSSEPVTVETSLVKVEECAVVEPISGEIPATGHTVETTIGASTISDVSSSVEDPRSIEPDSTTDNEPADNKTMFKLNPNAKTFKFNLNAQEFKPPGASFSPVVTAASSTPASPSHTVTTYHPSSRQHRPYKRQQRTTTPTQGLYPTSEYILQSVPQPGGFMIPQGGMVRPGQTHFLGPGNQVLFPAPYQLPSAQPGLINAYAPQHLQQVVTTGVSGAPNTHPIMLTPLQHQQLFQQQLQAQQSGLLTAGGQMQQGAALLPGVGQGGGLLPGSGAVLPGIGLAAGAHQGQPYQQVIYSPQGGQMIYTQQGGVPAGGGATPMGVSAGTMPLHSNVQQQPLISAVNLTQPQVFTPGRIVYPPHPPGK